MRAYRLSGSSAVFRVLSTFENMLRRDEALAYSARNSFGYIMVCFSYESLGACPSTWSAAYCAHLLAISVLFRMSRTSCALILYTLLDIFFWIPARTAACEKHLDNHVEDTGLFFVVIKSGFEMSCLLYFVSFHVRYSCSCVMASRSRNVVYRTPVLTRTSVIGTGHRPGFHIEWFSVPKYFTICG